MRATGIIRRIDELGRVVIPKEIRRNMRLREGDPLEIYLSEDGVILKKYSPMGEMREFAKDYAHILHRSTGFGITICDRDIILTTRGAGRDGLANQMVGESLLQKIMNRRTFTAYKLNEEYPIPLVDGGSPEGYAIQIIVPVECDYEAAGAIIATMDSLPQEVDEVVASAEKIVESFALLMAKQLEG